jgi:hypothetical protein
MDKEYYDNKEITVYWWNMGSKTLDYRGSYEGYLKLKGVKIVPTTENENYKYPNYHFDIPLFTCRVTLDTSGDYAQCCNEAIKIFLTLMGDKAKLISPKGDYFINWR